jgi:4-diphosphocytidyl-2-C-methyl-D-erythritol kinase
LENLKTPLFVRMTGSGSVIVAYYQSKRDCELAKVQFKRKFKNYWCNASKTI